MTEMSPLIRATLIGILAIVITMLLLFFVREDRARCPDGEVPVLSEDKWVCVPQGG